MKKLLIPAIGAALAFSPVVLPMMFGTAPAHAQAKAKKGKDKKHAMCSVRVDDRYQESWATSYGCWGVGPKLEPMLLAPPPPGFGPPPAAAAAPKGKKKG